MINSDLSLFTGVPTGGFAFGVEIQEFLDFAQRISKLLRSLDEANSDNIAIIVLSISRAISGRAFSYPATEPGSKVGKRKETTE